MRVICIDGKPKEASFSLPEGVPLNGSQSDLWDDFLIIEGYSHDLINREIIHWHKRRFIPLSQIDEKELQQERNVLGITI